MNKDRILKVKKQYYENNKDTISKVKKQYYENNKDTYSKLSKERVICQCGADVCRGALKRHQKSKRHRIEIHELHNVMNHLLDL